MEQPMYITKYVDRFFKSVIISGLKQTTWITGNSWTVKSRKDKKY